MTHERNVVYLISRPQSEGKTSYLIEADLLKQTWTQNLDEATSFDYDDAINMVLLTGGTASRFQRWPQDWQ